MKAIWMCALVALTGCAGAYGPAKTTPDIVGVAATADTMIKMTITGKDTVKVVEIKTRVASAPASDVELKHHELEVKRDVGVARAEQPKFVSPFLGGNYSYSAWSDWGWGSRRIDSPRIARFGRPTPGINMPIWP